MLIGSETRGEFSVNCSRNTTNIVFNTLIISRFIDINTLLKAGKSTHQHQPRLTQKPAQGTLFQPVLLFTFFKKKFHLIFLDFYINTAKKEVTLLSQLF